MISKIGFWIGIFIGIAGLILTIYIGAFRGGSETKLELHNTSSIALAAPTGPLSARIRIFLDDEEVQQLWLATFRLVNTGDVDIGIADFGQPIKFTVGDGGFVELIPDATENDGPQPEFSAINSLSFSLNPLLLKTGEAIGFSVVSSAKLTDLTVSARAKGLDEIPVISTLGDGADDNSSGSATGLLIGLGALMSGVVVLLSAALALLNRTMVVSYSPSPTTLDSEESGQSAHVSPQSQHEINPFPFLISVTDTLGNARVAGQSDVVAGQSDVDVGRLLRPGDVVVFMCRVFFRDGGPCEFSMWVDDVSRSDWGESPTLRWEVNENDIGQNVRVMVLMRSKESFHAHGSHDDVARFFYRVWPHQQPEPDNENGATNQ